MGDKDHLATPEEIRKNQRRDLKKIVSNIYQAVGPVLTQDITSIGNVARTTGEVRDTAFPVLADIDDLTDNVQTAIAGAQATVTLQLDKANAQFQRLKLDDIGGTITSFIIDMTNLAQNKALEFIADIETLFTGTPTVAFQANGSPITLEGLPPSFPLGKTKFKFNIAAIETPVVTSYEVLSSADDFGGGGVSFPIIPPVSVRGNVNTTQNIDLSISTAHVTTMTLTANIDITFSSFPATANQIEWEVEIKQDATGGRIINNWPAAVTPTPVLDSAANATTIVVLRTNDNGTIIRTLTSAGGGGDASLWANFAAVANIDANNNDILKVKNIDMDDANSTIQGIKTLQFFDDAPNKTIGSVPDALEFRIPVAEQYDFFIEGALKFSIEQVATGQPALIQLFGGSLEDAGEIIFDAATDAIIISSESGLGMDNTNSRMVFNVPLNEGYFFTKGGAMIMEHVSGAWQYGDNVKVIFNPTATLAGVNVGSQAGDVSAPVNADILYNSSLNKFRFRENGAWVELGGGGSFANLQLDNLVATVRPNLNMLANRTTGGTLGGDNATDSFFQIHADKINFANQTSIAIDKHVIGRVSGTNNLVINAPLTESIDIRINGVSQVLIDGTDVDFSNQNLIDVQDVGSSTDAVENYWAQKIRFPANVIGVQNTHNIFRALKNSTDTMVLNIPTNNDFIISENDTGSLLSIDTSANTISIGLSGTLLGMNLNDKSMSFPTGSAWTFNSSNGFGFLNGDVDFDDNDLTGVNNIFITTASGAAIATLVGFDASTDIFEIKLGAAVDFVVTDDGNVRLEFDNTLLTWKFGGSSLVQLPQETQISDRASAPSTPPSGFMNLYVINVAGAQTFKVKFDNGVEKDIANDV